MRNGSRWLLVLGALLAVDCEPRGLVGGACREGRHSCGGDCVDLTTDAQNCGACGVKCPAGRQCHAGLYCEGLGDGEGGRGAGGASGASGAGGVDTGDTDGGMAGASGEGGGPGSCGAPLEVCGSVCVDLVTDPRHCGACGHECPTGLCESGACLGGLPGHIVVLCSSYEEVQQQHPQTVLLGNAVFLSRTDPVRILAYTEHSESGAVGRIVQVLDWATEIKGQASMLATAPAAAQIPTTLSLETFDVFLVLDQPLAPAGELARIGAAWAATLDTFVGEGGTVVVLQGAGGAGEMASLVSGAQLFDVDGQNPLASGEVLYNRAPSDSVGMSVLSPFRPLAGSCRLETAQAPDMSTVFVVTDTAPGGALGNPSTVHRVRGY